MIQSFLLTCAACGKPTDTLAADRCPECYSKFFTPKPTMPHDKKSAGLYHKFNVTRTDGTDQPGGKHEGCEYFVLDLTHDPFALPALKAYAEACRDEYPILAADLQNKIQQIEAHRRHEATEELYIEIIDDLTAALNQYLKAGHKEARKQASIRAKATIANVRKSMKATEPVNTAAPEPPSPVVKYISGKHPDPAVQACIDRMKADRYSDYRTLEGSIQQTTDWRVIAEHLLRESGLA